ncbi:MAG: hypothetical protein ABII79_05965 [bacterium]
MFEAAIIFGSLIFLVALGRLIMLGVQMKRSLKRLLRPAESEPAPDIPSQSAELVADSISPVPLAETRDAEQTKARTGEQAPGYGVETEKYGASKTKMMMAFARIVHDDLEGLEHANFESPRIAESPLLNFDLDQILPQADSPELLDLVALNKGEPPDQKRRDPISQRTEAAEHEVLEPAAAGPER